MKRLQRILTALLICNLIIMNIGLLYTNYINNNETTVNEEVIIVETKPMQDPDPGKG